jgi:DNA-binding MarR family transcriptional regulator
MSDTLTLSQRIGQAENALRAVLDRLLTETGTTVPTTWQSSYVQWVTLALIARGGAAVQQEALLRQISGALKCDAPTVLAALDALTARGLVTTSPDEPASVRLTTEGDVQFQHLRQRIDRITERLIGDLPRDDLATTQRVLGIVTERANVELGRQS